MAATGVESQIWEALRDRAAALTFSPALPVAWPNVTFPASGTTKPDVYLEVKQLRADTAAIGISKWNDHAGILQIDVVYKPKDGIVKPMQIADAVAAWFPRNLRLANGSVVVQINEPPSIASPVDDNPYTRIPVSIRYRSFNP